MTSVADDIRPLDRRVRRTQKALRDAFISLVLERGYDHVSIEDITERADVARATFYAHYADKDALFATLFAEFSAELTAKLAEDHGPPDVVHTNLLQTLYEDAFAARDLYRLCLGGAGNGRARARFQVAVADACCTLFADRAAATPYGARIPVEAMARAFAGALTVDLEAWLSDDNPVPADEAARQLVRLLAYGYAWAWGSVPDDVVASFSKVV